MCGVKQCLALLLGVGLLCHVPPPTLAQTLEEQTVFAALALNIVRFTVWPKDTRATIDLCVVGDNVVQQSFVGIDGKAVGDKTLRVVNLSRLRNFEACQVLYVSELKQAILSQVFAGITNAPVLTIGEGYDFAIQGGMVGLENSSGKITLHVNLPVVREAQLTISARLLKLANIIGK